MKRKACFAVGVVSLLLWQAPGARAAGDMYHPYQSYDQYYKEHSVEPPPPPAPPLPPSQPVPEVKPVPREQPVNVKEAPEFLFPPALGFGVAVGVPFDMFYVDKSYYVVKSGAWYRSSWYKGPWLPVPITRVPPELRKVPLSRIHELRNKEFAKFWKNRSGYQGKYFRPGEELPPSPKDEKPSPKQEKPAPKQERKSK